MLLGQNVNSYGKNLEHAHYLCTASSGGGKNRRTWRRIRFMTSHPKDLSDELIRGDEGIEKNLPASASASAVRL